MHPQDTADRYNRLAQWWQTQHQHSQYGIAQLERAIQFTSQKPAPQKPFALDVGCGSSGRLMQVLSEHGFEAEGLDISEEMICLAQQLHPHLTFYAEDICTWTPPQAYSLIVAWDSTFHLPLDRQEPVTRKLCNALEPGGVLLFTCGGKDQPGEISGSFEGQDFDYSTLGVNAFLKILMEQHCTCLHLEYDQYPERHVYIIARKMRSILT